MGKRYTQLGIEERCAIARLRTEGGSIRLRVYNNTPRKCLGYRTPVEVLREQVLHFECESTFLPLQERR